jgi:NAD(P)-dependent dehydrogenase (short-subunit alcohol dehydrogenase family)
MERLAGKTAIVTGAAQGIGRGIAHLFADEGARLILADLKDEGGLGTRAEIEGAHPGTQVLCVRCDVGDPGDVERLVQAAEEAWGPVAVLVNNAAAWRGGTAVDMPLADWELARRTIYDAAFLGAKYAVPSMERAGGGSIINIASVHGLLAARRSVAYEAAKGALITLTKQLAVDYGPQRVRVNAICPGLIVTEAFRHRMEADPARARVAAELYPLRRYGEPLDIARAAVFLASEESSFITGHALVVDGGLTAQLQDDLGYRMMDYLRDQGAAR